MYDGVPRIIPCCVEDSPAAVLPSTLAMPKSMTRGRPAPSNMMLAGFRSRWMTPLPCA